MIATIFKVDPSRKAVYAFAPGLPPEDTWFAALTKTCSQGQSCRVRDGDLFEFAYMDIQKQEAMGLSLDDEGLLLGVQIHNQQVWKAISTGQIQEFNLTVDGNGVQVSFEEPEAARQLSKTTETEEILMEESDGSVFKIQKSNPNFELIAKCVGAVQSKNLGSLKQASFERALDAVTKAYAQESGLTEVDAADAVLRTELGGLLYSGYVLAPVELSSRPIAKAGEEPSCCQAINQAAEKVLDRQPTLTKAQAVTRALEQNPGLYTDYLNSQQG